MPRLDGIRIFLTPYVDEKSMVQTKDGIYLHSRLSCRAKRRRPHGRTNGPRRWKVKYVRYQPVWDRLRVAASSQHTPPEGQ